MVLSLFLTYHCQLQQEAQILFTSPSRPAVLSRALASEWLCRSADVLSHLAVTKDNAAESCFPGVLIINEAEH